MVKKSFKPFGEWAIKRIVRVEMIRGYNGLSKQFGGTVYVHLEDANRIFYIVNGD